MTIDIYSTPTCGYCKQLKALLDSKSIAYTGRDVTESDRDFDDMQAFTDGGTSVPVTVVDRGTPGQKVAVGFDDALRILELA
jgi:glutaredoxin